MDIVESPREWLIRKGSLYYRSNRAGYTAIKGAAGRYTQAEAEREAAVEPGHIVAVHQDRVPDDPVPASEAAATILRKRVAELEGALERLSWSEKGFAILSSLPPDLRGMVRPSQREDEVYLAAGEDRDERLIISISEDGIAYCYQVDGHFCPGMEDWQDPHKIPKDVVDHLRKHAPTHQRALEALEQVLDDSRRGLSMAPATRALALYAYAQAGGSDPDILAGLDAATAMLTEIGHFGSSAALASIDAALNRLKEK